MKEHNRQLSRPLIVGHGRDGRCLYDKEAKRELVEICQQPGISVAKVALEQGINANLLRKWMDRYRGKGLSMSNNLSVLPTFVPVLPKSTDKAMEPAFSAELPNGVKLTLQSIVLSDLPLILNALAELPCSVSTQT